MEYSYVPVFTSSEQQLWDRACASFEKEGILDQVNALEETIKVSFLRGAESMKTEEKRIKKMTKYLKRHLEFRKEFNVDSILTEQLPNLSELKQALWPGKVLQVTSAFDHANLEEREKQLEKEGKDYSYKANRLVILLDLKDVDFKKAGVFDKTTLIKHITYARELLVHTMRHVWKVTSRIVFIYDLRQLTMSDYYGAYKAGFTTISQVLGQQYPESVDKLYVINPPRIFGWVFKMLKPFIEPDSILKIKLLRGDKEILSAFEREGIDLGRIPSSVVKGGNENCASELMLEEELIQFSKKEEPKTLEELNQILEASSFNPRV